MTDRRHERRTALLRGTPEERHRTVLLHRYAAERRPQDLEALVVSYRPLACALARRYAGSRRADPDLEQVAYEGLVKALQRFEPSRGTSFTSFAVPTILGEVRRHLRDTAWPAHVPRKVQERVGRIRRLRVDPEAAYGREPTVAELAAVLRCSEEDVVDALCAESTTRTVPLAGERDQPDGLPALDHLGAEDPAYEQVECLLAIADAMPSLPPDEQAVVGLHFGAELTQRQIAARLGVSRSHVGRLLGSAVEHLRAAAA